MTLGIGTVCITACASSSPTGSSPSGPIRVVARSAFAGQPAASEVFPAVTGAFGERPHVAAGAKDKPTVPSVGYVSEGTGDQITPGTRPQVRYVKTDWATGTVLHDSWAAGVASEPWALSDADIGVSSFLNGVRIGSRLELINTNHSGGDATVFVVDVIAQGIPRPSHTG
jgi:hypothetical protein